MGDLGWSSGGSDRKGRRRRELLRGGSPSFYTRGRQVSSQQAGRVRSEDSAREEESQWARGESPVDALRDSSFPPDPARASSARPMCERRAKSEGLGRESPPVCLACCRPRLPASKQRQALPSMSSL